MLPSYFVAIGTIIGSFGSINYFIYTLQGKVKPNKVTYLLWSLVPFIAFAAEIQQGVGIQSLLTFSMGFFPLMIFIASFINKKSEWKISKFDIVCGILSLLGLILWFITKVGNIAIIFSILSDGMAGIPTIRKSYRYPETEIGWNYLTASISALFTLLTIKLWNFANAGFPVYILIINLIIFLLVKFQTGKKKVI
jgi:hypothetical protein